MPDSLFPGVPQTPRGHFRLSFYGAVLQLLDFLRHLGGDGGQEYDRLLDQHPFLKGYLQELQRYLPNRANFSEAVAWWQSNLTAWQAQCPTHLPLVGLPLEPASRTALLLLGAVEEDSRFGDLFASLQHGGQRRPTLELAGRVAGGDDSWAVARPLVEIGLAHPTAAEAPRAEWELAIPTALWDLIRGEPHPDLRPTADLDSADDLLLPAPVREQVARLPDLVRSGAIRVIMVRGMNGSGRLAVLGAVARSLGCALLEASPGEDPAALAQSGLIATLTGSMPAIRVEPGPGESVKLPDWKGYHGPTGVVLGLNGGVAMRQADQAITITLPPADRESRLRCWREAMGEHLPEVLLPTAAQYHMPPGQIRKAAATAITLAALEQREQVTLADIRQACRTLGREGLETLAVRLEVGGEPGDLVVAPPTRERLEELTLRCRFRDNLTAWLPAAYESGGGRGVRALFSGPSGTGKTLAARILAATLGMELYRVDLASVVNKYIGETEKNLNRLFARAEELDVMLLLDEGDSLLARRSDVRSANDRYANLETNFLLQRLEAYQGIVLITTNAAELIDTAFQRRMDVIVPFSAAGPVERHLIWMSHLPPAHEIDPAFLQEVAMRCALTGGQIRNAAIYAALRAMDRGGPITARELQEAIASEYRKVGALSPLQGLGKREGEP